MTKEEKYKSQLSELGIYSPAFDPEIHELCILERELRRAQKQWKNTVPDGETPLFSSPIYGVITRLRQDILAHRNALGLTPSSLRKLKGQNTANNTSAQDTLSKLLDSFKEAANGET